MLTDAAIVVDRDERFAVANPINDALDVQAKAPVSGLVDLVICDLNGRIVRQWREENLYHSRTSVADLLSGVYVLQIRQAGRLSSFKVLKI